MDLGTGSTKETENFKRAVIVIVVVWINVNLGENPPQKNVRTHDGEGCGTIFSGSAGFYIKCWLAKQVTTL